MRAAEKQDVNLNAADVERECRLLYRKISAGADFAMSMPVYSPDVLRMFRKAYEDRYGSLALPVLVGVLPLVTSRHAEFLHNEVPGMQIPAAFRERMAKVGSGPEARAEGVAIAREALAAVKDRVAGAYIMPPFNRVDSAAAILEVARDAGADRELRPFVATLAILRDGTEHTLRGAGIGMAVRLKQAGYDVRAVASGIAEPPGHRAFHDHGEREDDPYSVQGRVRPDGDRSRGRARAARLDRLAALHGFALRPLTYSE